MSVRIYYFSGTGNSLHVARELQKKIPGAEVVPMISALRSGDTGSAADTIGLVFPVYAFSMPSPVKDFLEKGKWKPSAYFFAVATRGGSPCKVFSHINNVLKKRGATLSAGFFVDMPNNYIPSFELDSEEEVAAKESEMKKQLDSMQKTILEKRKSFEKDPHEKGIKSALLKNIVFPLLTFIAQKTRYGNMEKSFIADSKCTECGICQRVCPSGKIALSGGKPEWRKNVNCYSCFACLHYCPAQAVQLKGTKTAVRGRYHHREIYAQDIAAQKK